MKKALLIFLSVVLLATAIPAMVFADSEASYIDSIGGLTLNKFVSKYCVGGSVAAASGDVVGTGSIMSRDGKDYTVIVRGDINGDGRIQSVDYLRVKKYFAGSALDGSAAIAADVNADGTIKSVDYLKIKSYFNGTGTLWSADANVGERFMGYRIWNFKITPFETFKATVDSAKEHGFNMINLHMPWYIIEKTEGEYDYSAFDQMMDYIISKGMKACVIIYLARQIDDGFLPDEDFTRDPSGGYGNLADRYSISFSSENAVTKALRFYRNAVEHFNAKYGKDIVMFLPCTACYCEMEYCTNAEHDYSVYSKAAFRKFVQSKYETVEDLNKATGSRFGSFNTVEPPTVTGNSNLQLLWFQFKETELKKVVDALADITHEINPDAKFCLQTGSVTNRGGVQRGTMDIAFVGEKADIVWVDDGYMQNHRYNVEFVRGSFDDKIEVGDEIDSPGYPGASAEAYLDQGMQTFEAGGKYVICANWGYDANANGWGWIWKELADKWLNVGTHTVSDMTKVPEFDISLYDFFEQQGGTYEGFYSSPLNFNVIRDLTDFVPKENKLKPSFPACYSTTQGAYGWNYNMINKGNEVALTMNGNRWSFSDMYIVGNVLQPGRKIDAEITYTCSQEGNADIDFCFTRIVNDAGTMGVKILVNDTQIYPAAEGYAEFGYGTLRDTVNASLESGDVVKFVFNSMGDNAGDVAFVKMEIKY